MSDLTQLASAPISSQHLGPVTRRELHLWLASALFANQAIQLLDFNSFRTFVDSLALQNYISWFGCYVCLHRLNKTEARASPESADWYFAFALMSAMLLSSFIAYRFSIGFLATALGVYLLVFSRADGESKAAGAVLLALSAHIVWGPILFQFLTPELLRADAALVGGMLKVVRPDIIWSDTTFQTPEGFTISLVGACSSFHNLSTALLACAAATMFMRTNWMKQDLAKCAAAVAVMIFLNDVRICLLAWSPASYEFWHNAAGSSLFSFFVTATLLTVAFRGAVISSGRA